MSRRGREREKDEPSRFVVCRHEREEYTREDEEGWEVGAERVQQTFETNARRRWKGKEGSETRLTFHKLIHSSRETLRVEKHFGGRAVKFDADEALRNEAKKEEGQLFSVERIGGREEDEKRRGRRSNLFETCEDDGAAETCGK